MFLLSGTFVRGKIPQRSIDSALCSNSVTPRGEQFSDTRSVKSGLGESERSPQASASRANDNGIVFVVNHRIFGRYMWLDIRPRDKVTHTCASFARRGYRQRRMSAEVTCVATTLLTAEEPWNDRIWEICGVNIHTSQRNEGEYTTKGPSKGMWSRQHWEVKCT